MEDCSCTSKNEKKSAARTVRGGASFPLVGGADQGGPRGAFYGNQGFSGEAVPGDAVDTSIDDGTQ